MTQKILALLVIGLSPFSLFAQTESGTPSGQFTIRGDISKTVIINTDSLVGRPGNLVTVDSLVIFTHDMQPRHTIHQLKGVLIRDILSSVKLTATSPKDFSRFYFVFEATDGYKVVFSWNELFNNETGNHVMVVVSEEGKATKELDDRIALISPTDMATGRRYVKWLKEITVARVK